jgi:uncharacterized membrane protein/uncharacterized membrane protein YbhN (UPF0104 family)
MKDKTLSLLKFVIGWPLSLLALYFIFQTILSHRQTLTQNIASIHVPSLIIGSICFLVFYLLRSYKWQLVLQAKGHNMKLRKATYLWGISEMRRYIPGNIWAVLGRAVLFSKEGIDKKVVIRAMVAELSIVIIATALVSILAVPYLLRTVFPDNDLMHQVIMLTSYAIIIGSLIFIFQQKVVSYLPQKVQALAKHILPLFPPATTLHIILVTAAACLFFGLGYYFSILSISFLHPQDVFGLSGFFVLSLLLGFLSFLTPAGLGVREGIVTVGLTPIMPVAVAGFASLFARLILVITEVLFLGISYLWSNTKHKTVNAVEDVISTRMHEVMLGIGVALFMVYFSVTSMLRHDNFYTGRFDLGNMAQTVWNTTQGRVFQFTNPDSTETVSRLAFHADYILVLFAPFYMLWSSPNVLLLLQAVIVGFGAVFVYLISQHLLKNKTLSLIIAVSFLLNPSLQRATLYDFHAVTLVPTFFLGAFYFMLKEKYVWFVLFLILAGLTKEQVWSVVALFAIMLMLVKKNFIIGIPLLVGASFMFYYLIWHAIPSAYGGNHFALSYYSDLGDNPASVIRTIIFDPLKVLSIVLTDTKIDYLRQLLLPLGYLPLFFPLPLIFAGPDLMINLLSNNAQLHQIYYQYTSGITPFLFISMIYGVYVLKKLFPDMPIAAFSIYVFCAALYGAHAFGPLPGAKGSNLDMYTRQVANRKEYQRVIHSIPKDLKVTASNNLGAHFSEREHIYTLPFGVKEADVVAMLLNDPGAQPSLQAQKDLATELKSRSDYKVIFEDGDFIILQRTTGFAQK